MNKGSFKGLIPLVVFVSLYIGTGLITGSFEKVPLLIHLMVTIIVALLLQNKTNPKTMEEKIASFCKGAGNETIVLMIVIFLLSGAFFGVAKGIHGVETLSTLGLQLLHPQFILPGLFLLSCIISFAMGTSMGTVAAVAPLGLEIAGKLNLSGAFVCGIVLGGAMFGDNLSFISDTTIAATRTQQIKMKEKFKANSLMVLPAFLVNLVLLSSIKVEKVSLVKEATHYSNWSVLPYLLVILLALLGMHVMSVLAIGVFSGIIVGFFQNPSSFLNFVGEIYQGISSMEEIAIISLAIGGLVALMKDLGGIDWLLSRLTKKVTSKRQAEFSIAALVSFLDMSTANNTISILTVGPLAKEIGEQYEVAPARTASLLDLFSSAFNGLLPYSPQLLMISQLAGVSSVEVMKFNWYSMLMIVSAILSIVFQIPKVSSKQKGKIL